MNRQFLILVLLLFLPAPVQGQINRNGIAVLRNFDPLEYGASEQNWSLVQDHRGVMYFGNNDRGVLEFDGQNWRSIPVDNNSPVRSLAVNEQGTIFVGAVGELGYLTPDLAGNLEYRTLTHLIDSVNIDFSDIWKTYTLGNKVYFSARTRLYLYQEGSFKVFRHAPETSPFFSFLIDEDLYWGSFNAGLLVMEGDSFSVVDNGGFFTYKDILSLLPWDEDHLLVGTAADGVYLYNKKTGDISDDIFNERTQAYLRNNILYHGTGLPGGFFAFATLYGGAVIINSDGEIAQLFSTGNGLRDEMTSAVYNYHEDGSQKPLWLTMNNGLAYIEFHNPVGIFGEESDLRGLILDVVRFRETLFVATMAGVFLLEFSEEGLPVFRQIDDIRHAAWSFAITEIPRLGERLIIGTQGGVYMVDNNFGVTSITQQLEDKSHNCFAVLASGHQPGRIYLGLVDDLEYIEFTGNRWVHHSFRVQNEIRSIQEDREGNIWLGTYINGLIKIGFTENDTIVTNYRDDRGLPEGLKNILVHKFGDELLFATEQGIYNFDTENEKFIPDERFSDIPGMMQSGIFQLTRDDEGIIWVSAYDDQKRWISALHELEEGGFESSSAPYRSFPSIWCDVIYPDDDNIIWFGISNRLYSYNKNTERNYLQPFNALIRKVKISHIDSVLFHGTNFTPAADGRMLISDTQPDEMKPKLRFANNRLEFEFSSPFFDSHDKTEFSFFLEGEDRVWSNWSTETRAQYTYLPHGYYTFRVKARNIYGAESREASFNFYIYPPWHRTTVAYISYLILLALFIWVIVLLNSRRLKKEKMILEGIVRERTAEIIKQKEEIEEQRDKIAEQNKNITDSIEYARRIQTAILPPGDYVKELLPQRFILFLPRDIVSGDFYWLTKLNRRIISVAADCTGHGVPGGFMSMLGVAFLNEIVNKSTNNVTAGEILDQLREQVIASLHQTGKTGEAQDGMDVSLFILDWENKSLEFAGANNPLIIVRDGEIIEIKGDKMPIGIHDRANEPFTNHIIALKDNDVIYTLSDGFQDQFGGPKGKKFMIKRLKQLLLDISGKPMSEQKAVLERELIEWQGSFERVDDIIVMGVRI